MTTLDVIILSNAYTPKLKRLTDKSLSTLLKSEEGNEIILKPLIIEQNPEAKYSVPTLYKTEEFNYNRFMNYGIEATNSDYIALCNNDLFYRKNWASNITSVMFINDLLSASPIDPIRQTNKSLLRKEHEIGFGINQHLNGWCLVVKRKLFNIIGKLPEKYDFWYSDNLYASILKEHNIKHALVPSSRCIHLGGSTYKTFPKNKQKKLTTDVVYNNDIKE